VRALILVAAITALATAQSASAGVDGSWTAEFQGRTFIRLELNTVDGSLTGSISTGAIQVDDQGGLRQVDEPTSSSTPIFDVAQKSSSVTFARKDGDDTDRFAFRVLDDGRGELQLVPTEELRQELAAAGIPIPKPIVLTRLTAPKL
jgi:hypothetical protein